MSHIDVERLGPGNGIGRITINRPERFNSLDVRTAQDFRRAGLQLSRDDAIGVVIVRGLPGMFCSGADLKFIRGGGDRDDLAYLVPDCPHDGFGEAFKQILEYLHSAISEIRRAPKPFIAAVDGVAAAGGFGIAMCCDLVIASRRATFEWAYGRTGLSGAESATFMLPRLVGMRRAMELVLLSPRLTAARALEYGLITEVFSVEDFDKQVLDLAVRIGTGPRRALSAAKELLNRASGMDRLDDHLDRELQTLSWVADGAEFAEGLEAFFAKRPARFGGAPQARPPERRGA